MSGVDVLTGPRITLRAPTLGDAELLFERIASDPDVTRCLSWRPHPNVDETRRVITEFFNIGFCLGRRWWRQGLMSEAVQLLLDKAQRDPTILPNISPELQDCLIFGKAIR